MSLVPHIYADFNAIEYSPDGGPEAEIVLTGYGTLASLARQRLRLTEGMKLVLCELNDIECDGIAHFDRTRIDPAGRLGAWVARIDHTLIRESFTEEDWPKTHPCSGCGADLNTLFKGLARSYTEHCPLCSTSVMAPMAPPENVTSR